MPRLRGSWERWLSALTLAEAGEREAALAELRPRRLVLLALRRDAAEPELFRFAANLCRRVNAGLVTVWECSDAEQPPASLLAFADEARREGLFHEVLRCEGPLAQAVTAYADAHPCVAFVMVDGRWQPTKSEKENPWRGLACPLVLAGSA